MLRRRKTSYSQSKKTTGSLPVHVAFIMDGNGRWATKRRRIRSVGHREGVKTMRRIVKHVFECGVKFISVYAFSTENKNRPKEEVDALFDLIRKNLKKMVSELIEGGVRVKIIGDTEYFPPDIQKIIDDISKQGEKCDESVLCIALNYGSRSELARAVNLARNYEGSITEDNLEDYLYTKGIPDIDLLVRTGGEKRLSNFMLYQAAYAELYFTDTLWPDLSEVEVDSILEDYKNRERRFGRA